MGWEAVQNFTIQELNPKGLPLSPEIEYNLGTLAEGLQHLRDFANRALNRPIAIHVNAGYAKNGHSSRSQHYRGLAADIVIYDRERDRIPIWEQYQIAVRHGLFRGIGVYPYWHRPGLHVDLGPKRGHWWEPPEGRPYLALDNEAWKRINGGVVA